MLESHCLPGSLEETLAAAKDNGCDRYGQLIAHLHVHGFAVVAIVILTIAFFLKLFDANGQAERLLPQICSLAHLVRTGAGHDVTVRQRTTGEPMVEVGSS